jgi:hypothetical protein
MKYIGKTEYKPLGAGQTSLFENRQLLSDKASAETKEKMPNWFWELAKECKTGTSGC